MSDLHAFPAGRSACGMRFRYDRCWSALGEGDEVGVAEDLAAGFPEVTAIPHEAVTASGLSQTWAPRLSVPLRHGCRPTSVATRDPPPSSSCGLVDSASMVVPGSSPHSGRNIDRSRQRISWWSGVKRPARLGLGCWRSTPRATGPHAKHQAAVPVIPPLVLAGRADEVAVVTRVAAVSSTQRARRVSVAVE